MSGPALVFEKVTRRFGRTVALDELNLTLECGHFVRNLHHHFNHTCLLRYRRGVAWPVRKSDSGCRRGWRRSSRLSTGERSFAPAGDGGSPVAMLLGLPLGSVVDA